MNGPNRKMHASLFMVILEVKKKVDRNRDIY